MLTIYGIKWLSYDHICIQMLVASQFGLSWTFFQTWPLLWLLCVCVHALLKLALGYLSSVSPECRTEPSEPDTSFLTASDGYLLRLDALLKQGSWGGDYTITAHQFPFLHLCTSFHLSVCCTFLRLNLHLSRLPFKLKLIPWQASSLPSRLSWNWVSHVVSSITPSTTQILNRTIPGQALDKHLSVQLSILTLSQCQLPQVCLCNHIFFSLRIAFLSKPSFPICSRSVTWNLKNS